MDNKQQSREVQSNSKIQMHTRREDKNVYKEESDRRHGMEKRNRILLGMGIVLILIFCLANILPTNIHAGVRFLSLAECLDQVQFNVRRIFNALGGAGTLETQYIIFRYLGVATVGATLALCGAVYQGAFKNTLASPSTLGVQSGGVMGGTIHIMFFASYSEEITTASQLHRELENMNLLQRYEQGFFILAGCFLGVAFVVTVSKIAGKGKVSSVALILAGTVFGSFIRGIAELIQYWLLLYEAYGMKTYELRFMMLGTFDRINSLESLLILAVPACIGIAAVMLMRNRLNLLVFGEDEARVMGIRVERTRNLMIATVTVLTALVISFCGQIGFIGFIIPHLARRFVGPDFRYLIPGSALLGATCMTGIYYIANLASYASNINFITSLVGGSAFFIMIIRFRNKRYADWA